MYIEEKTFNLRFSLEVKFSNDYDGDEDECVWLREWEQLIKPHLMKAVFTSLREHLEWTARIRNRGMSQDDEIEIALTRDFS